MSGFLNEGSDREENYPREINFEEAVRLPDGGSTCEIYRTKWQRREVFVKRLKPEYRSNPLYLDALDKEYEIGVGLKHPALPDYREFHRDYIVMDYVDGATLADMIKNQDPWLINEKNIIRMLRELIDVTDYLHRHNVTHCDIKPDNIIITANNKNLVLVDLDKCYTDSLNDTSGDPSKYGLSGDQPGRIAIDFHGVGRVVEIMKEKVVGFSFSRYAAFIKECYKPEPSTDDLLQILDYKPGNPYKKFYWMVTVAPFVAALLYGAVLLLTQGKGGYDDAYGITDPAPQEQDTLKPTETPMPEKRETTIEPDTRKDNPEVKKTGEEVKTKEDPVPQTKEQIDEQTRVKASYLDKRIQPMFDELNTRLDNLEKMKTDPDITREQYYREITTLMDMEDEYCQEAFEILKETYPNITEREAWRVMSFSKAYTGYKHRASGL